MLCINKKMNSQAGPGKRLFCRAVSSVLAVILCAGLLGGCAGKEEAAGYAALETANYGVMTGSTAETFIGQTYPQAKISTYSSIADAFLALSGGKIDYVLTAYTTALNAIRSNDSLVICRDDVIREESSIAVSKDNKKLCADIDGVLDSFKADGTLDRVAANWTTQGQDYVLEKLPASDGRNGILKVAIAADREPMCFVMDGRYRGLDCELIERIAGELGMTAEYQNMQFSALTAALASGKADVIISNMTDTPERRESVDFTQPYFANPQVLVARGETAAVGAKEDGGFPAGLKASFTRTFITENRWKLIVNGLVVTILISVCSGILGSALGFGVCMLRRSRSRMAGALTAAFIRIIQGTPVVVLLMLLYYVIFGGIDIPAIAVSVIGFIINFAVYVSEMMRTGIDAVDKGQIEAAIALGYSKRQTFAKVTFPQAARHFLPVFKGEFISMVKMTSVVGYIAVQDLTKVSDIIRSRTLEAFFPLIATAVLYFMTAGALTAVLSLAEVRLDPRRRPRRVKGVNEL